MIVFNYGPGMIHYLSQANDDFLWIAKSNEVSFNQKDEPADFQTLYDINEINVCYIGEEACIYLNGDLFYSIWSDEREYSCEQVIALMYELQEVITKQELTYDTTINLSY